MLIQSESINHGDRFKGRFLLISLLRFNKRRSVDVCENGSIKRQYRSRSRFISTQQNHVG